MMEYFALYVGLGMFWGYIAREIKEFIFGCWNRGEKQNDRDEVPSVDWYVSVQDQSSKSVQHQHRKVGKTYLTRENGKITVFTN
jgi:hypothetical protein